MNSKPPFHQNDLPRNFSRQQDVLERRAFLWSTLIHCLVIALTIVSFRLTNVAFKPSFVFLGSILGPDELIEKKSGEAEEQLLLTQPPRVAGDSAESRVFFDPGKEQVRKHVFSGAVQKGAKVYRQTTFLEDQELKQRQKQSLREMGINPDSPPRVPLRLKR